MLGYVAVLLIAALVGVAVYLVVLRLGVRGGPPADVGEWEGGAGGSSAAPPAMQPGSYVPVTPSEPSWHSRMGGVMGLVIAVTIAALGIAFALYLVGHALVHLIHSAGS